MLNGRFEKQSRGIKKLPIVMILLLLVVCIVVNCGCSIKKSKLTNYSGSSSNTSISNSNTYKSNSSTSKSNSSTSKSNSNTSKSSSNNTAKYEDDYDCSYCAGLGGCDECLGDGMVMCTSLHCFNGDCIECGGTGEVEVYSPGGTGGHIKYRRCTYCNHGICKKCKGTGEVKCSSCGGKGKCPLCGK